MTIAEGMLPEYDHEMRTTRTMLERVPEKDESWAPHPRSMTLGRLVSHIASMPGWIPTTLRTSELDVAVPGAAEMPPFESTARTLETFDRNVKAGRDAIAATSDADFALTWTLRRGDQTMFTMPRTLVMRSFVMNHLIHHRGQLGVYLRLRDVPLPSVYGPTADAPR